MITTKENPNQTINMELIKITETNGQRAVSARELHQFLEVETRFNDWISRRIEEYQFIENQDFEVLLKNEKNQNGGRPLKEYIISIDMAKELSMVERNEKGKLARLYFIECEKIAKNPVANLSKIDLAQMVIESEKEKEQLQIENKKQLALIEEQKPKVLFAEALAVSEHNILIGELAKILKQNGVEIGQNRLFEWLRDHQYLMKSGEQRNLPTQKSLELGLLDIKTTTINNPDGSIRVTKTTKVKPKGQAYFVNKFLNQKSEQ